MRRLFKAKLITAPALVLVAVVAIALTGVASSKPVTKTHQFRCTDRNTSLYFLVYEIDGNLDRGLMYVENMQVANMTVENAGTGVIKAKVNGNAANVAFQLHKSGKVMVANYQTSNRVEVCTASYKYQ